MRVLLALSGGVDSSVAAYMLKEQGHDVSAVYMKTWVHEDGSTIVADCPWEDDIREAEAVSKHLGIDFEVVNYVKEYRERVVNYLVDGYKNGTTPNPDIMCNREMKFGVFLDYAMKQGFDKIATGHYVRVKDKPSGLSLLVVLYKKKYRSYFLALLKQ